MGGYHPLLQIVGSADSTHYDEDTVNAILPALLVISSVLADAPAGDLKRMQGRWTCPEMTLVVEGTKVIATFENLLGTKITMRGEIVLDEARKTMDWVKLEAGDEHPLDYLAIYKFEGDTLVICGDAQRPTAFDEEITMTFKRE
jgi:uncharacterized protein (TIGR03067 family)